MPLLQSHLHPYGSSRNSTSYAEANIDLDQLEFLSLDSKESEINARYNTHRHHGTLPSLGQFVNGVLPGNGSTLDAPLRALKMDRSDCSQAAQSPSISKYLAPPCNLPYSYANWPHNIPRAAVDSTNDHRYPPTPVYVPHSLHMTFEDTCNLANIFHRKLSVKTCQDMCVCGKCSFPRCKERNPAPAPSLRRPSPPVVAARGTLPFHNTRLSHKTVDKIWDDSVENLGLFPGKGGQPVQIFQCRLEKEGLPCCFRGLKQTVKRHIEGVHLGIRSFRCPYPHGKKPFQKCDRVFPQRGALFVHVCSVHTKETPFPCAHCGLGFSDPAKRHKHVKNEHPEVIVEKRTKSPYAHIGATSVNDSDCTDSDSRPARPLPSRRAPVEAPRKTRSSMSIMVCSNMPRFHRATQT